MSIYKREFDLPDRVPEWDKVMKNPVKVMTKFLGSSDQNHAGPIGFDRGFAFILKAVGHH